MDILVDFRFIPGGRIMHGAGRENIKTTLNNCYVVGIKNDSIEDIYQTLIDEAKTYKYGGGCGHDLSVLRPSGDAIKGTGGKSCGPTGFMDLFSVNTNTIAQHGRRGANMQTLRVDHPDIDKFIAIKQNLDKVRYSNTSVLLTHEFMHAVEDDTDFDLRWGGTVYRTVKARDLWGQIITAAHSTAEPGLLFWDTMRDYHNGEYISPLVSTNPCAEQPLPDGGCCNLGSINLERFVDDGGEFMLEPFKETVEIATRFLDNVIDYNLDRHALEAQKENAINDRRIGLGLLGMGDMFVRMQIRYDSQEALDTMDSVLTAMRDTAYRASVDLAGEKGAFPNFDWAGYSKSKFIETLPADLQADIESGGVRNVTVLTVPPTGSGAIVAQVTSGIEPVFATSYKRRVKQNDVLGDTFKEYTIYHPVIKNLFGNDKELPDYVVTAHDIDPFFRVKMQGLIQRYIDSSISSTVNLSEDISVETVADIYMTAYREGLKGITVYREGSREGILITNDQNEKADENAAPEATPSAQPSPEAPPATEFRKADSPADPGGGDVHLHPRARSDVTFGMTRRIRTGEGNLYVTINEDEKGLCEVFTTIGKAGGSASTQAEAISRLISLALRSGVDAGDIVRQLKGISGPNPMWDNGRLILSTPDAISQVLSDYLTKRPWSRGGGTVAGPVKASGDEQPFMLTPSTAAQKRASTQPAQAQQAALALNLPQQLQNVASPGGGTGDQSPAGFG
ncbi:MAG: adenosylcobalamin-dependent ribonucleoside-diphosphate reductase, partial [Candidatus Marinimicrobia bacterium]|nr:adenosylcobalamin-dependent ribonucleoside-diphosphate reductase [Candidatus Neomarinimicrobiota bacterium]